MLARRGLRVRRFEPSVCGAVSLMQQRYVSAKKLQLIYLTTECGSCPQPIPERDRGVELVVLGDASDTFDTLR